MINKKIANQTFSNSSIERPALYCVWIRPNEMPEEPLVAVWIDSQMRAFSDASSKHELHALCSLEDGDKLVDDQHLSRVYNGHSL